jgi:thiol:disulfide interchange protein DsbA
MARQRMARKRPDEDYSDMPSIRTLPSLALAALSAFAVQTAVAQPFESGVHYRELTPAQPTNSVEGRVEVVEMFRYDCPGCYRFEPYLRQWTESKPDYVDFVRIPAVFNDLQKLHAQAFYTAETLGKIDEMHDAFFEEIHENGNLLGTEAALRDFFRRFGVNTVEFDRTFSSFAVHTKVQRATELGRRYRIPETPSIVVNGKYLSLGGLAGSYETWFAVVGHLALTELSEIE